MSTTEPEEKQKEKQEESPYDFEGKEVLVEHVGKTGKKHELKALELVLPYMGKPETFIVRRYLYGDQAAIIKKCARIRLAGGTPLAELDTDAYTIDTVVMALHRAPFPTGKPETRDHVLELEDETGEALFQATDKLNKLGDIKKKI